MNKDRSLLFGLLAVSMKKVRPDKMSAVARRNENDANFDLGQSLVDEGLLTPRDKEQIDSLVVMSLAEHEGDAARTIQELGKDPDKLSTLVDSLDDFVDAFEKNSAMPDLDSEDQIADSILGNFSETDSMDGGPVELDSLVDDGDAARTRLTQSGNTGDKASIGDIALGDAPDSFFQSMGSTNTQIMSPVQAAAELDESEIVPAVSEHEGRYETIREFAKGGMGQITLVHDTHLGRDIALKQLLQRNILPETRPGAPTTAILTIPIIARFLQEARITGQLEHPSIIPVYELGYRNDGSLYYTMKLIRGQSMHEFLKDCKDIRDRLKLLPHFLDLCHALSYAHSRGVIHRDLKPMNIMIGEFGETVLIDWGIAKVQGQEDIHERGLRETVQAMRVSSAEATAKTMYGQTIGSPYFMPAEQAMGRTDLIDERSDIYSLGAVLYVILTGQMPYAGNNVREFMGKVGQVEPKPVRTVEPLAPAELAAVVKKCMALVPENRYQSARELTTEIEKYLSGGMISAYDYNMIEIARRYYKKHKTRINTLAAAAVVLLAVSVYSYLSIVEQKNIALANEQEAIRQEGIAKEEEAKAKLSEEKAVAERNRAQQELYYANIANAKFNINEQQMAKARELLASCEPAALRQWEWGHLAAMTHADLLTVERAGRFSDVTADGSGLVTGTVRGTVTLHDINTGEVQHEFIRRAGFNYAVAGSADMSRIAVIEDNGVHVWDIASKEEIFQAPMPEKKLTKYFMAFSAHGNTIAALGGDNVLRVWDVDSGSEVLAIEDCQPNGFNVFLSPEGTRVLVARQVFGENGFERQFEVFAIPSGESIGHEVFPADSVDSVHAAAFSPNDAWLAVGTDNELQIWKLDGFEKRSTIPGQRFGHPDEITFSPNGSYVAAGTKDGNLLIHDVSAGKTFTVGGTQAHEDFVRSVRFTHGGTRLGSVADDRTVRLWSVPNLRPLRTYKGHDNSIYTLGFSQDDTRMASSSPAGTGKTKVWDISADLEFAPTELDGFTRVVYDAASGLVAGAVRDQVLVWNARTGHRVHAFPAPGEAAKALAFNTAGTMMAAVAWHENAEVLRTWDLNTGEESYSFPTGQSQTRAVHFVAGDRDLLVDITGDVLRFNTTGEGGESIFAGSAAVEGKKLYRYDLNDDHTRLAAGFRADDQPSTALVLPLSGSEDTASLDIENAYSVSPYFAPDGERILICQAVRADGRLISEGSVSYWNPADNTLGEAVTQHKNEILTARYSRDGALLATGDRSGMGLVWDATTLEPITMLRGHAGAIEHLDFHPDGTRLVTGSSDRSFKIWDTTDGTQLLTVNDAAVKADLQVARPEQVAFSEDGLQLATLTSPPVSPMILHAFSTKVADYPTPTVEADDESADEVDVVAEEDGLAQFESQMEAYKRQYWR